MDIYRSEPGRTLLRDWSSLQISRLLPDARCRWIDTPLGPTHLTTVGSGPAVVLLPGTTLGAAASAYVVRALAADHPAPLPNAVLTAWRDTPCVVLAGRRDPIFPAEELTRPARMLLGARVEFVADAGHLLAHSHPDAVRRGITAPAGPGAG
jgi:pimeloyl-ACP methyl ester carboxylesterase